MQTNRIIVLELPLLTNIFILCAQFVLFFYITICYECLSVYTFHWGKYLTKSQRKFEKQINTKIAFNFKKTMSFTSQNTFKFCRYNRKSFTGMQDNQLIVFTTND